MLSRQQFMTAQTRGENGADIFLTYYLLCEDADERCSYGAEIVLARGQERESACARDITASRQRIERLLALLCRNTVTPCTFREVLEETLDKI